MDKETLKSYLVLKKELKQLRELIAELESAITGPQIVRLTDEPRGRGEQDKLGAAVAKLLDIKSEYDAKLVQVYDAMRMVEQIIDRLPDTERVLMRHRYIRGLSWEKICVEMHYRWDSVHRIHRQALKRIVS